MYYTCTVSATGIITCYIYTVYDCITSYILRVIYIIGNDQTTLSVTVPQLSIISASNVKRGWTGELAYSSDVSSLENRMERQFRTYNNLFQQHIQQFDSRLNQLEVAVVPRQQTTTARVDLMKGYTCDPRGNITGRYMKTSYTAYGKDAVMAAEAMFEMFVSQPVPGDEDDVPQNAFEYEQH